MEIRGAEVYKTNLRHYFRRLGRSGPVRGLVYAVLASTHLSEPVPQPFMARPCGDSGPPPPLCWHSLALSSADWLSVAHPALSITGSVRLKAVVALVAGIVAALNGAANLAMAKVVPASGTV